MKDKKEIQLDNVSLKESVSNSFALMLEQTNGTYEETTDTEWPSEGYTFNKHMSGCIDSNGNTIENTLTYKNGTIKLKTKHNTYCYIYFDIDRPSTEELLATVPEEQLWDSTLEDDGYRYVGTNPDNYICFGTTDQEECMNDTDKYMYRIIGIFEDEEGQQHLKLIKKEALNTAYAWHSDYTTDTNWDESDLYKGINGNYFLTNTDYSYMQDSKWTDKISEWNYTAANTQTYYKYDAASSSSVSNVGAYYYYSWPIGIYNSEHEINTTTGCYQTSSGSAINCKTTASYTYPKGKISLMYASDYALSLGVTAVSMTESTNTNRTILKTGWMHISNNDSEAPSQYEWTSTRYGNHDDFYRAWFVYSSGDVGGYGVHNDLSIRPVFYLTADTKLDKGTGTIDNPYTIKTSPNLREFCEEYNNINECIENEENNIEEVSDLWNSTLEDDGIRFVGTNPNNYVCFGTTNEEECTSDTDKYMYRIIGMFEDEAGNHHLKLIKKETLGTYPWHSDPSIDTNWDERDLYKGINGSYFLTNTIYSYMQDTNWINRIVEWNYTATNTKTYENYNSTNGTTYGPYYLYSTAKTMYLHELNKTSKLNQICIGYDGSTIVDCGIGEWKTVSGKISIMYASDYTLSHGSDALEIAYYTTGYFNFMKSGWLHLSQNEIELEVYTEWAMTRLGKFSAGYNAVAIASGGSTSRNDVPRLYNARPVFYLTENIKITAGKGSITEPFIIN